MPSLLTLFVLAHGAYPLAYELLEQPQAPSRLVAGTTFGLLLSSDDGNDWRWVCEEAIGYGMNLSPVWWVSPQGRLLGGSFRGLFLSADHGCSWSSHAEFGDLPDGGQGVGVADLHSNGAALFATSGKYGVENGVWRSIDDGSSWQRLPLRSPEQFFSTIRSAPSRPQRLYVGAWWFRPFPTEALYWSDDNGDSFTPVDVSAKLPMIPIADGGMAVGRGSFNVYAVHPTDPETVFATLQQDEDPRRSYVLVTHDRGDTWQTLMGTDEQLNGIVVSPDGAQVWAGSSGKVFVSTAGGAFEALPRPTRQSCVARFGQRLYACGWPELDGFAVARDTGAGLQPLLTWDRVTGVAECPATSRVSTQCAGFFPALVAQFPLPDGGASGGAGGGGGSDTPPPQCRCTPGGAEVSLTLWLLLGRFAPAHALRRRRVHR